MNNGLLITGYITLVLTGCIAFTVLLDFIELRFGKATATRFIIVSGASIIAAMGAGVFK